MGWGGGGGGTHVALHKPADKHTHSPMWSLRAAMCLPVPLDPIGPNMQLPASMVSGGHATGE